MARKSLGHTTLFWICPNCETRNPGPKKTCITCGNPQPENVEFIQGDREELLALQKEAGQGVKGADIHCPFCGTRNPATAEKCSQCGGKLTGGKKRAAGRVVGAHKAGTEGGIICPSCGHENKPNAARCAHCGSALGAEKAKVKVSTATKDSKTIWMVIGLVVVVILGFLIFKGCSRSVEIGVVSQSAWTRTVAVEQLATVKKEGWWDEIPEEANVTVCEDRYRTSSSEPEEGAVEVCGTPYTIDEGTGYGEVVQDCEYQIFDTYCEYETSDWAVVEILEMDGYGPSASWPVVEPFSDQRPGEQTEEYTIWFDTENGQGHFTTRDYSLFSAAINGSEWELTYDGYGNIRSAQPK